MFSYDWGEMIDTPAVEENCPILSFRKIFQIFFVILELALLTVVTTVLK